MIKTALKWSAAIVLSFLVHAGIANWLQSSEEEVKLAGGAAAEVAMLGDAFADSLASGAVSDILEPEILSEQQPMEVLDVDSSMEPMENIYQTQTIQPENLAQEPVLQEIAPLQTSETLNAITPQTSLKGLAAKSAEISPLQPATPVETLKTNEIKTVETQETQPVETTETAALTPVDEVLPLAKVPVPMPRKEVQPLQEETLAKKRKPEVTNKKKAESKQASTRKKKKAVRKKPSGGDDGKNKASAKKGVADGSRTAKAANKPRNKAGNHRAGNAAVSNYPGKVQRKVNRSKVKPRSRKARGKVVVAFVVSKSGAVSRVRIARGSGNKEVDAAAIKTVQRAAPFPRIPDAAGRSRWAFNVPMTFR